MGSQALSKAQLKSGVLELNVFCKDSVSFLTETVRVRSEPSWLALCGTQHWANNEAACVNSVMNNTIFIFVYFCRGQATYWLACYCACMNHCLSVVLFLTAPVRS